MKSWPRKLLRLSLIASVLGAIAHNGQASTGELYGYGSRACAMGNTMLGGASDAFATFYNPAANNEHPGFHLSLSLQFAHPSFTDIRGIVVANSAINSATQDQLGNVDNTSYLDQIGQSIAASFNFGESLKNLTLGVAAFMQVARIAYLDTSDPFLPDYFSYRSRTQRPQIYASLGLTPLPDLHIGTGLAFATNLSATNNAVITTANGTVSYQRFASTIKPSVAPYFSMLFDPKPGTIGATIRLPNRYKVSIDTDAHTRLLGNTNDLPLVLNSSSSLFYDPFEVDLGFGYRFSSQTFFTLEMDWLQYKAFESPVLSVTNIASGPNIRNSISSLPQMRNIWVPKLGIEHPFSEKITLRVGYMYRPSPIENNSGPGNLVDPSRHSITAGAGIDLHKAGFTSKDLTLDLHAQYHALVSQRVTKSAGNETGDLTQSKVGAPGYDIGGAIYGGGMSISTHF